MAPALEHYVTSVSKTVGENYSQHSSFSQFIQSWQKWHNWHVLFRGSLTFVHAPLDFWTFMIESESIEHDYIRI